MAQVLEFVVMSDGDPSVGIQGFEDHVTIILHGAQEASEDDIKYFREAFAEWADGGCATRKEWLESLIQDRIQGHAMYESYKKEEEYKVLHRLFSAVQESSKWNTLTAPINAALKKAEQELSDNSP